MLGKVRNVLVVGQVPPPYHGQAISTERFLKGKYDHAELFHTKVQLSETMQEVGKFKPIKLLRIFSSLLRVIIDKFRYSCDTLYYIPSGGQRVSLYKDFILLIPSRWLFRQTIFHFRSAGLSECYQQLTLLEKGLFRMAYYHPRISIRLSRLNPPDGEFIKSERNVVIPNGMEDVYDRTKKSSSKQDMTTFLYIGSIRQTKGVVDLIDAGVQLNSSFAGRFEIILVGRFHDLAFKEYVNAQVAAHDFLKYEGEVIGEAKSELFYRSHVLVFPTYYENESFGLVNIEAAQFEMPVIATDWRANRDLIEDGVTGFIVPIKDPTAISKRMQQLIESPDSITRLGRSARNSFLSKHTLEIFYQNFDELFKSLA